MKITDTQVKIIHIAKQQLAIDDECYRDLLSANFKVSSCKELTRIQADELITIFKRSGFKQKKQKAKIIRNGKIIRLVTPKQLQLISEMKDKIVWRVNNGYQLWLKKRLKLDRVITIKDGQKVIEGLKSMLAQRKKHDETPPRGA